MNGLKARIEAVTKVRVEMETLIEALEDSDNDIDRYAVEAYREILGEVLQQKANLVSMIGNFTSLQKR